MPPMKNPTAKELWNFLIIMVPPMLRQHRSKALQRLAKHSAGGRLPIIVSDVIVRIPVSPSMEYLQQRSIWMILANGIPTYHHPAISFLEDPPQYLSARNVVYSDNMMSKCVFRSRACPTHWCRLCGLRF